MVPRPASLLLCALGLAACDGRKEPARQTGAPVTRTDLPSAQQVFPEAVLNSWGYLTTEVTATGHDIRSQKNYGDAQRAFYARFHLAKTSFASEDAARTEKDRIEALLKTEAGFKDYTQIIQHGPALYSICASSNYTFLDHQPKLLASARTYLTNAAE